MTTLIDRKPSDPKVLAACQKHYARPDRLIEILHDVQHAVGHVSEKAISIIAAELNLSRAEVVGVVSFYDDFSRTPTSGFDVRVCRGEACQATGGEALYTWAVEHLSSAGRIDVGHVFCLGNCALGPSATIGGILHGRLDEVSLRSACMEVVMDSHVS